MGVAWCHPRACSHITGGVRDNPHRATPITNAHHQRPSPTPITNAHHQRPSSPSSNLSPISTRQTLPGSQSEKRSLAERQGSLPERKPLRRAASSSSSSSLLLQSSSSSSSALKASTASGDSHVSIHSSRGSGASARKKRSSSVPVTNKHFASSH